MQWNDRSGRATKLAPPHAGRVYHDVGAQLANLACRTVVAVEEVAHADSASVLGEDAVDARVLADDDTPRACALRKGAGGVDRIRNAVTWKVNAPHDVVDVGERHHLLDLARGDHVDGQSEHTRHRRPALELLESCLGGGHAHGAALQEASRLAGIGFEGGEEFGGVLGEAGEVVSSAELADKASRMPGCSAGELRPLEQHHVGDSSQGEVVGHAAPYDSAADDYHTCVGGQLGHESSPRSMDLGSTTARPVITPARRSARARFTWSSG
ncbi:unannotated protein [freshwater metagenome]|uniref:Unannotated protein n=1 Tax=freshwater metagenome TaxID=449393 RepID=A0A6J7KZG6_9ZZZZ